MFDVTEDDCFIVMACDGIWDVLDDQAGALLSVCLSVSISISRVRSPGRDKASRDKEMSSPEFMQGKA
jgi:hypothetical protein